MPVVRSAVVRVVVIIAAHCQHQNSSVAKSVLFKFFLTKEQHAATTIKANSNFSPLL